jgi:ABC-type cobalamin/Fe3+-siderophores transport system ATPase subunit
MEFPSFTWLKSCIHTIFMVVALYPLWLKVAIFIAPVLNAFLLMQVNNMLRTKFTTGTEIAYFLGLKLLFDAFSALVMQRIMNHEVGQMIMRIGIRINLAQLTCGETIPGDEERQIKEKREEQTKLRDFLYIIPLLWTTTITFVITIANIDTSNGYPLRLFFSAFCVIMIILLSYFTDHTLYEQTKPNATRITKFFDIPMVKTKIGMGCVMDTDFEIAKSKKRYNQQKFQRYAICLINFVVAVISIASDNVAQIHIFGSITWMIAGISDNIKSLYYKDYIMELITMILTLEKNKYKSENTVPIGLVNSVRFHKASFGYYDRLVGKNLTYTTKIKKLTFEFKAGKLYYIEAPNGIGKSTTLRMFQSNLSSGSVYFGSINRRNIDFYDVMKTVFHVVQSSEYSPKFSREETKNIRGKDVWLEQQLDLEKLFNKDFIELSGGQKKRMLIYIVLTSDCPVLLLDEILSELSTEETPEVPEGGGWLNRIIKTIVAWEGRKSKIIVLVGHGILQLIPNIPSVEKLGFGEKNDITYLKKRQ